MIEQRVTNESKSTGLVYVLWWFFGTSMGLAVVDGLLLLVYVINWIVDAFILPKGLGEHQEVLRRKFSQELAGGH